MGKGKGYGAVLCDFVRTDKFKLPCAFVVIIQACRVSGVLFAKIYGKRIDLNVLEQLAKEYFGGETAALADDKKIYFYTDADVTEDELAKIRNHLPFGVDVFEIRDMETVPRKSSGKIDYRGEELCLQRDREK